MHAVLLNGSERLAVNGVGVGAAHDEGVALEWVVELYIAVREDDVTLESRARGFG